MTEHPGTATANAAEDNEDETEPLPGDVHYPWLERKMQHAYTRLVGIGF